MNVMKTAMSWMQSFGNRNIRFSNWKDYHTDFRSCKTDILFSAYVTSAGPPIALKRIDSYDGSSVTFHYNRHEDNAFIRKTVPAMDFISLLIQHIPDWNFKKVRYYGLYARHREQDKSLRRAIQKNWQPILKSFNRWQAGISCSFGYAPWNAPNADIKWYWLIYTATTCIFLSKHFMKGQCLKPGKKPDTVPLDFFSCLSHTGLINRQEVRFSWTTKL